jgi:hypothetical protein
MARTTTEDPALWIDKLKVIINKRFGGINKKYEKQTSK